MPWRVLAGAPEAALTVASLAIATLGGSNLWQQINAKGEPEKAATAAEVIQSPTLFSQADFAFIQNQCIKGEIKISTETGEWHSTKKCTLPTRGMRSVTLPLDEILYDNKNQVIGFKRMLVTEERKAFFKKHLTFSVTETTDSCARLGQGIFPLLIVVKKQLCEPLAYNQV